MAVISLFHTPYSFTEATLMIINQNLKKYCEVGSTIRTGVLCFYGLTVNY